MNAHSYEEMLKKHHGDTQNAEASWDLRAKSFGEAHKKSGMDHSDKVTQLLLEKGVLANRNVLDIGGGTGRYAVPFAEKAREVTIADISTEMLKIAKNNAESAGRRNLQYVKLNWSDANLTALGWEKHFDLAFASMCPGVRSKEDLEKMCAASRGWCQINQFIEWKDNISEMLRQDLKVESFPDPHNDRDAVQAIFNLLWTKGYEPEISYQKEFGRQVLSVDEAMTHFLRIFGEAATENGVELRTLLAGYASGGSITMERQTTLSMILWKA
ncbi:MAG: class I SAM-dependent methyltransferase [Clostridia bacterium]|nr:class I SAM-dependent methyltransferase [Clostridia bacterium]